MLSKQLAAILHHPDFQKLEGTLKVSGKVLPLKNAKLEGAQITFAAGETPATTREYSGAVNGNSIVGTTKVGTTPGTKWTADRRPVR